jgi:hypothetical protein
VGGLIVAVSLIAAVLGARRLPAAEAASLPPCFGQLSEHPLPEILEWARDVRWAADDRVYVSSVATGIFLLTPDGPPPPAAEPELELAAGPRGSGAFWGPNEMAVSESHLAAAAIAFAVGWKRRGKGEMEAQEYFESAFDLDLRGEILLVLGLRKDDTGKEYEANGAYAWLGLLGSTGLENLRPLAFSSDGGRARAMDGCHPMSVGAVRFLEDGSFVVVPVSEPGVFLYRADGTLERSWQSEELGLDGGCGLSEEQVYQFSVEVEPRGAWINARRIAEDALALGGRRFGLIIRERVDGTTRWTMRIVAPEGPKELCDVGLTHSSPWVRLRADRRRDRVALLRVTEPDRIMSRREHLIVPPSLFLGHYDDVRPKELDNGLR